MAKKPKKEDALVGLLKAASPAVLTDLILELATDRPDIRRECFDSLKTRVSVSKALEKRSAGEIVLALWSELEPDLCELDDYGGGDYGTMDHVAELLDQIRTQFDSKKIEPVHRQEILDRVLAYIKSGNAGMDDMLFEVLGHEARWNKYAAKVKQDNIRRPAFQEEFARMLPGWRSLK
jgi:hypothetical protein